jgi:hypothetical protein
MFTDELITQVRNLAQVPDNDEDITDEFILTQAYLGLLERFTQPVVMMRNGTWLHSETFVTTAGVSRYRLPSRSIVQGLEKLECAMGVGLGNANSSQWYLLNIQTNVQATDYEGLNYLGRPAAFTYVGDTIEIFPTPTQGWTIRMWYYLQPSEFVTSAGSDLWSSGLNEITSIGGDQYSLVFENNTLDTYASSGLRLDLQFLNGNAEYPVIDATMVYSGTPNTITVTLNANQADILARSLTNTNTYGFVASNPTFVIPLPRELCNALVSYVGAVVLAEKGDAEKAQVFSQKAELAIKNIVDLAMPRAKGQPNVFKTRNTYLRRRIGRWGWGGGWGQF